MYYYTAYPSGVPEFTPGFKWGSCYSIFSFICLFCRSLFVLLYFFFWTLCCLFFFDIRILIAPLVSSNSSCLQQVYRNSRFCERLIEVCLSNMLQPVNVEICLCIISWLVSFEHKMWYDCGTKRQKVITPLQI